MMDELMNNEAVKEAVLKFQQTMKKWITVQTTLQLGFIVELADLGLDDNIAQEIALEAMGEIAKEMAAGFGGGDPSAVLNGSQEFIELLKD